MASVTQQIKSAAWAFIALALVGWILGLIGLAGTQAECWNAGAVRLAAGQSEGSGLTGAMSTYLASGIRGEPGALVCMGSVCVCGGGGGKSSKGSGCLPDDMLAAAPACRCHRSELQLRL